MLFEQGVELLDGKGDKLLGEVLHLKWKLYRKWSEIYNFNFSDGWSLRELDEGR